MWLGSSQIRLAHTDVSFPDFSENRRDSVKDSAVDSEASAPTRKAFTYLMLAGLYLLAMLFITSVALKQLWYSVSTKSKPNL